jgi:hypothetical protein
MLISKGYYHFHFLNFQSANLNRVCFRVQNNGLLYCTLYKIINNMARIKLPNNCSRGRISVYPKNWQPGIKVKHDF